MILPQSKPAALKSINSAKLAPAKVTPAKVTPAQVTTASEIAAAPPVLDVSGIQIKKEILSDDEADDIDPDVDVWRRERPHECPMCQRRFKQKHHLTDHMITHTGEKKYPCLKCGKKFVRKSYLPKHDLICEGKIIIYL